MGKHEEFLEELTGFRQRTVDVVESFRNRQEAADFSVILGEYQSMVEKYLESLPCAPSNPPS